MSTAVDNAPPTSDIIQLSQASSKTLTFSRPVDNLSSAVVSLNSTAGRTRQGRPEPPFFIPAPSPLPEACKSQ